MKIVIWSLAFCFYFLEANCFELETTTTTTTTFDDGFVIYSCDIEDNPQIVGETTIITCYTHCQKILSARPWTIGATPQNGPTLITDFNQ